MSQFDSTLKLIGRNDEKIHLEKEFVTTIDKLAKWIEEFLVKFA